MIFSLNYLAIFVGISIVVGFALTILKIWKFDWSKDKSADSNINVSQPSKRGLQRHQRASSLLVLYSALFMALIFLLLPYLMASLQHRLGFEGTVTAFLLLCLLSVSIILSIIGRAFELDE